MNYAVHCHWSVGVPQSDYPDKGSHGDHVGVCVGPCGPQGSCGLSGLYDTNTRHYAGFPAGSLPDDYVLDCYLVAYGWSLDVRYVYGRCSLRYHGYADRCMEVDQQKNYSVWQSVSVTLDVRWGNSPSGLIVDESRYTANSGYSHLSHEMHGHVMNARVVVFCASSFGGLARNLSELCLPH